MGFADDFVDGLKGLKFPDVFNPYSDTCPGADLQDAPERRSEALRSLIRAAQEHGVDDLWIGRDLGHKGGRRTGLAFTDDAHLARHCERWGIPVIRPTRGWVTEATASAIWQALDPIRTPVFLWNVFPLHPHGPGAPFSNRRHGPQEGHVGRELLVELIAALQPLRLIAIGGDAHRAVKALAGGLEVHGVRHPSFGGTQLFLAGIRKLYGRSAR